MSSSPLRPPTEADADQIAALFTAAYGDWRPTDAEEVRTWLRNQEIPDENIRVLEIDGQVVGYGDVWLEDDLQIDVAAPDHWDTFLDWAEDRAQDAGMTRVRAYFPDGHELEGVVAARGYEYWRSAFVMHIDLDESLDPPELPALTLRPYRDGDAETLRAAINEAFAGDPFFHEVSPGNFREFFLNHRGSDDTTGWVANLGVRPAWRRRGLGGALLQHAFRALYDRGLRRAGLGVDAKNVTGALRLYENAGMHRAIRQDNWVKDL